MNRGCCWRLIDKKNKTKKHVPLNVPYCYYPEKWDLYKYINYSQDGNNFLGFLEQKKQSAYMNDVLFVKMETTSIDSSTLRVKVQ